MKTFSASLVLLAAALTAASCGCSKGADTTPVSAASEPAPASEVPEFSADSAYANVAAQVAFGPRIARSEAHDRCAAWLASGLARHGADTVIEQRADLPGYGPIVNILGRFNAEAPKRLLLLAHWDSRPWADNDPDPANHTKPIDGANDGASGVGVLLETARLLGKKAPAVGVDILFVDAEDSGSSGDDESWALGSKYWAENMPYGAGEPLPAYAVLLDMVGGRDAAFPRELFSEYNCRDINNRVWKLAAANGLARRFPDKVGGAINDDHLPLIRAGIPAIDIIETDNPATGGFNPTWHTIDDNINNIDRRTLGDVGRLISLLIYSEPL